MKANTSLFFKIALVAVIALLIITVNPIGSHAIAKGAYRAGIRPDKPMEIDDLGRDLENE